MYRAWLVACLVLDYDLESENNYTGEERILALAVLKNELWCTFKLWPSPEITFETSSCWLGMSVNPWTRCQYGEPGVCRSVVLCGGFLRPCTRLYTSQRAASFFGKNVDLHYFHVLFKLRDTEAIAWVKVCRPQVVIFALGLWSVIKCLEIHKGCR